MDLVDPSLLADLIFQWHEAAENLDDIMDSVSDLPVILSGPDSWPERGGENDVVEYPSVVENGATLDLACGSPRLVSPSPRTRRLTRKRGPKSEGLKAPAKSKFDDHLQVRDGVTHAEHIIRERQRRDDMAAKYLILESLLPPSPKVHVSKLMHRERAAVVEDATLLVRGLQQKKAQLLKRRAELKLKIVPSSHESPLLLSAHSEGHEATEFRCNTSAINVRMAGKNDAVVEIMFWTNPPPNFHSVLLQAVENLGAEVTRCSVARVAAHGSFVQCFMTCSKPHVALQVKKESVLASENVIMGAIRNVLTKFS